MADSKDFQLGNKARDLLIYTFKVTKPVSEKSMETKEVLSVMLKLRDMEPAEVKKFCDDAAKRMQRVTDKQGYPKSTVHSYIGVLRGAATNIVKNVQLANDCRFETEYDERLRLINEVLRDCNLMLQLIDVSLDLEYINLKRSKHWTKMVTDVKYMTLSWKKKDGTRAAALRKNEEAARNAEFARAIAAAFAEAGVSPRKGTER